MPHARRDHGTGFVRYNETMGTSRTVVAPDATGAAEAPRRARAIAVVLGLAIVSIAIAAATRRTRGPSSPAGRGAELAVSLGCVACHGPHGAGGVPDPGARAGFVPGWDGPTVATFARDEAELREWILDGRPRRLPPPPHGARAKPALPMPAYRGRLTDIEIGDLVAYLEAVSAFGVELPDPVFDGRQLAIRLGCFGCHGPAGIARTPNPGSFKGYIPPWDGSEWAELVHDEAELREWILDGRPERLQKSAVARHFLDGQALQMPAYRAFLTDDETTRLVAYLQWLRAR